MNTDLSRILWKSAEKQLAETIELLDEAMREIAELRKERDTMARDYDNERYRAMKIHDQIRVATDLGDKRWKALNEIYTEAEKRTTDWCRRKAAEGMGLRKD